MDRVTILIQDFFQIIVRLNVVFFLEFSENVGIHTDEEMQTLTLTFPNKLKVGDGVIRLKFSGELNDKMKGFYRSKYFGPNKEERYAAVTQFEVR